MSAAREALTPPVDLNVAAVQAIGACGCDLMENVKVLIVANDFLEVQLEELRTKMSAGYGRLRFPRRANARMRLMCEKKAFSFACPKNEDVGLYKLPDYVLQ
jgi:hypothetical protein